MERLSTLVMQKLLDAFFLGLDAVDEVRRRVDRVIGRPAEEPFEVVWPETKTAAPSHASGAHDGDPAPGGAHGDDEEPVTPMTHTRAPAEAAAETGGEASDEAEPPLKAVAKPKAKAKAPKKKEAVLARPKVPLEITDLADKVKAGALGLKPLAEEVEVVEKRMLARVIYVLGAAEGADLGALTSTEVAHVLTVGCNIDTFGTNISRAIRQGVAGLVEERPAREGEPKRYALTEEGRQAFAATFK